MEEDTPSVNWARLRPSRSWEALLLNNELEGWFRLPWSTKFWDCKVMMEDRVDTETIREYLGYVIRCETREVPLVDNRPRWKSWIRSKDSQQTHTRLESECLCTEEEYRENLSARKLLIIVPDESWTQSMVEETVFVQGMLLQYGFVFG